MNGVVGGGAYSHTDVSRSSGRRAECGNLWNKAQVLEWSFKGYRGRGVARTWQAAEPRYIALLAHGYGEHLGRYEYVAQTITVDGGTVYAVDHAGHGKSEGQRVLIDDFERVVDDFHQLAERAQKELPGLPMVLIGHSMGGLIAARYAQRYGGELAALVLSGPVLGRWATVSTLLASDVIPDTPIDPATLSCDPEVNRNEVLAVVTHFIDAVLAR